MSRAVPKDQKKFDTNSEPLLEVIVSNLEDDGSFSMKFIEMEFHGHSGIGSCLRDL